MLPPCLKVCLRSSGSRIGSISSPMFSRRTGVPNWIQFSSVRTKSLSVSLMTWRLWDFSMFLIHLLAWPWGSMRSGQRRALLQRERERERKEGKHDSYVAINVLTQMHISLRKHFTAAQTSACYNNMSKQRLHLTLHNLARNIPGCASQLIC